MKRIKIEKIRIDPENANIHTKSTLESRMTSIQSIGLQYPIKVVKLPKTSKNGKEYQIVDGESRFLACRKLNWTDIPCEELDIDVTDKEQSARYSFALNKEREMCPFAECRHVARLYREKKAKPENSRKSTALRTEIGDEFGYSESLVHYMIQIGRIPSRWTTVHLEQFSISALKSLLPLRIGNVNSNTGEDNIDYTLVRKCIKWLEEEDRIPPSIADISEYKDIVSDDLKDLAAEHKAIIQVEKKLKKQRKDHEKSLQKAKDDLRTQLAQAHNLEMEAKENKIARLQTELDSKESNHEEVEESLKRLRESRDKLRADIDKQVQAKIDNLHSKWQKEHESQIANRLSSIREEYEEKISQIRIDDSQKDIKISRLEAQVENKDKEIEKRNKTIQKLKLSDEDLKYSQKYIDDVEIYCGDIKKEGERFDDDSIDLILTDPPYPKEFLPCWEELSKFAKRTLKGGKFLVTYSSHINLARVMSILSKELEFYWIVSLIHSGAHKIVKGRNAKAGWKPILIFQKLEKDKDGITKLPADKRFDDVIQGSGREKKLHKWQQGLSELYPLIEAFSNKDDLIVDPFAGSGTTLLAAVNRDRQAMGIEKKAEHKLNADKRIKEGKYNG